MRTRRIRVILPVLALFLLLAMSAEAAGPLYMRTSPSKMTNRFLRGAISVPLCIMEIPKAINKQVQDTDLFTGCIVGAGEGTWQGGKRLLWGVLSIVTFPATDLNDIDVLVDHHIPYKELAE
ncbi:MAG TPA: hypothetical protein PLB62_11415 [Candidatus Sumerlaeota bacterium]|nr:hypothetical protein [Candidatus Sumerlaeota bacterium]